MKERNTKHKQNIIQTKAKILFNKRIVDNFYKISIRAPKIAKAALPGQFLNIKVNDTYQPLLRKPLGINRIRDKGNKTGLDILYKVVGEGTEALSHRQSGEYIDILGPLGNGFSLDFTADRLKEDEIFLVAGGIGIAPLLFLAERILENSSCQKLIVLIGAKTKSHILCQKEFKDLGCNVLVATDDGSCGFRGNVTDLFRKTLGSERATVYICGPRPMLKETARIGARRAFSCFGLLEEYMACGTGACFGCVVATTGGYKRVCKEGPVFDLKSIKW
ncbi:MAG: dihydroorotate dehydrogenase electron transfer subunit [Candidatus Omnitrophica bacterium]|nr:dihydroorotate dehydrogenase electron transfer subunit [Candidatus Omnitrophota bacterium]